MHTQNFMIGFVTKFHYIHSKEVCAKVGVNCFHVPKTPSKSQQTLFTKSHVTLQNLSAKVGVSCFDIQIKHLQISTNSFTCFFWSLRMIVLDDNKVTYHFIMVDTRWHDFLQNFQATMQTCKKQYLVRKPKVIVIAWTINLESGVHGN